MNPHLDEWVERLETAMYATVRRLGNELAEQLGEALTPTQLYLLKHFESQEKSTISEIALLMGVKPSAVTGIVDRMHNNGLVDRFRDERDRRVVYVSLTKRGKEILEDARKKRNAIMKKYVSDLDPHVLESMMRGFEQLQEIMSKD